MFATPRLQKSNNRRGHVHPVDSVATLARQRGAKNLYRDRGGGSGGGTYREDGDEDACSTQHRVVDGLHVLLRVPDAVVVAVEAPLVGLDCACLDDEEGQPGYKERETTTKPISNTGKHKQLTEKPQDSTRKPLANHASPFLVLFFSYSYLSKGNSIGICFSKLVLQGKSISSVMVIRCLRSLVPVKPCALQILTYRNRPLEQSLCKRP